MAEKTEEARIEEEDKKKEKEKEKSHHHDPLDALLGVKEKVEDTYYKVSDGIGAVATKVDEKFRHALGLPEDDPDVVMKREERLQSPRRQAPEKQ